MAEVAGTAGYAEEAQRLFECYERRSFESVHAPILNLLPKAPAEVLEIGAGTGRDAAGFARRGYEVVAVEPVDVLREGAQARHPEPNIQWVDDGLPDLARVRALGRRFDVVAMTAVLMHLHEDARARALTVIASLMKPGGILAMTLRHGPVPKGRIMFDIPNGEIETACEPLGLHCVFNAEADSIDQKGVTWTRLVLRKGART